MKVMIKNKFHEKGWIFTIDNYFAPKDYISDRVLTNIDYEIYSAGQKAVYAKKKYKEIKAALCGSASCACDGFCEEKILM